MKKFNEFLEAVLIAKILPTSDSVNPIANDTEQPQKKDMFSSATDDFMKEMGCDSGCDAGNEGVVQPDDGIGETGEIEAETSDSNIELECLGEEGLQIKFNGLTFVLPSDVVEAIKSFESDEAGAGGTDEENVDHEESESKEEETAEHAEGGSEETKDETEDEKEETETEDKEKKNPFTESVEKKFCKMCKKKPVWGQYGEYSRCKDCMDKSVDAGEREAIDRTKHFTESEQIPIVYKIKRKSSTNEWVVAAYVNGKFDENKSYFTDDKQDAIGTMKYMQEHDPYVKTPITEAKKLNKKDQAKKDEERKNLGNENWKKFTDRAKQRKAEGKDK